MNVWLLWRGEYSSSYVAAIFSTEAQAEAAALHYSDAHVEGPHVVDDEVWGRVALATMSRWKIEGRDNTRATLQRVGPATGEPLIVSSQGRWNTVTVDAADESIALKAWYDATGQIEAIHAPQLRSTGIKLVKIGNALVAQECFE